MTRFSLAALVFALVSTAGHARAFQDPNRFASAAIEAGGGGRYFTGSPADGFTCTVCHAGYAVPLRVSGLPAESYAAGRTYRIVIDWPDLLPPVGLNAEVTNRQGQTVGQLKTPPMDQLQPADLCEPVELGMPGAGVLPVQSSGAERQVGVVFACGAKQATFEWVAPPVDTGPVWFTGSLVASDQQATVGNDGVVDFAHVIGSPRQSDPLAAEIAGGCSMGHGEPPRGEIATMLALLALACVRRRTARSGRN